MPKLTEALRSNLEGRCYETMAEFKELQVQHESMGLHSRPHTAETSDDAITAVGGGFLVLPYRRSGRSDLLERTYRDRCWEDEKPKVVVRLRRDGVGMVRWELPEAATTKIIRNSHLTRFRDGGLVWTEGFPLDRLWRLNLVYDRMELDNEACREFKKKLGTNSLWVGGDTMGRAGFTNGYQQIVTAVILSCRDMMNEADQKAD